MIGTGVDQIPDMTYFTSGRAGGISWFRMPGGLTIQHGYVSIQAGGGTFTLPVAMGDSGFTVIAMDTDGTVSSGQLIAGQALSATTFHLHALKQGPANVFVDGASGATYFLAISRGQE